MEIVAHRINLISVLLEIPFKYGCEIDIRSRNSKFIGFKHKRGRD